MMAVMVPLVISHDGAVHKDTVKQWENFALDIQVDWVRMAQSVLRYNVVVVGKFFNKGCLMSEAWKREHPEDLEEEPDCPPERIPTTEERMRLLSEDPDRAALCVRSSGTPPPHSVRLMPAGRGNPTPEEERTNQPL